MRAKALFKVLFLTLLTWLVVRSAVLADAQPAVSEPKPASKSGWTEEAEGNSKPASARPKTTVNTEKAPGTLSGSASSYSFAHTQMDFELGVKALDLRLYSQAQQRLTRALDGLKKTKEGANQRGPAHLMLAETYMGLDNLDKARTNLDEAKSYCQPASGIDASVTARYFADLAEYYLAEGSNGAAAESAARQCLEFSQKSEKKGHELAYAQALFARALCKQSYYEEAKGELKKALAALEMLPGRDRLSYADALSTLALVEKKLGNESESAALLKNSLAIRDDAVILDKIPDQKGVVKFDWVDGMSGSRQIVDPVYPLKYMVVGGVRVACTIVRSYKNLAVLISLANCTNHPIQLSVGAVELIKTKPGRKSLEYCDPGLIDEVLEEDVILDRTWRRETLCHIQKSRKIPGYLKGGVLDPDDFFGNNQWGLYGAWDSHLREAPPIVTRDQYFYDEKPKNSDQEILGFMRGSALVRPTFIEPGGARSGVVFYLRDRYDDAVVKLFIGNAELRFPFHAPLEHKEGE